MFRRNFLKASALFGAGALAGEMILPATASAKPASKRGRPDSQGTGAFCSALWAGER